MNSLKKEIELPWTKEYISKILFLSNDIPLDILFTGYDSWKDYLNINSHLKIQYKQNYQQELFKYKVELLLKE